MIQEINEKNTEAESNKAEIVLLEGIRLEGIKEGVYIESSMTLDWHEKGYVQINVHTLSCG